MSRTPFRADPAVLRRSLKCRSALPGEVLVLVRYLVIGVVQISRDEFECIGVGGANDGEVPAVERGDLGDTKSFGCCYD